MIKMKPETIARRAAKRIEEKKAAKESRNTGPDKLVWAGASAPPAVGERIRVTMNGLGMATVVGYFSQDGFLGLRTKLETPPAWYLKQNGGNVVGCIFGPEFKTI